MLILPPSLFNLIKLLEHPSHSTLCPTLAPMFPISPSKSVPRPLYSNSELPFTSSGSIYHLGLCAGQLANRIVTVGDPQRALLLSKLLTNPCTQTSHRLFTVVSGQWKGIAVSIVSIGMGYPNMEIFIREARAVTLGTLWIIRLGSCGSLSPNVPLASFVIPSKGCTRAIMDIQECEELLISPSFIFPDCNLTASLKQSLPSSFCTKHCSCDTFYHSQGRHSEDFEGDAFKVRDKLGEYGIETLEMETFLAFVFCWQVQVWEGGD